MGCMRILNANCMQIQCEDEIIGTALFGLASFFNHSCRPNVELMDKMETQTGYGMFRTVDNVRKGNELCIQYADANRFETFEEKQAYLMFAYGFYCNCALCCQQ